LRDEGVSARVAARQSGAALTGSEHLLLAILATCSLPERSIFAGLGVTALDIEQRITNDADDSPFANSKWARRWTAECVFMFASCLENRLKLGDQAIHVRHLANAMTHERYGRAAQLLSEISGDSPARVRRTLMTRLGVDAWSEPSPGGRRTTNPAGPEAQDHLRPEVVALLGFEPEAQAHAVSVDYHAADHAQVEVGFPGQGPHYGINLYHYDNGWRADQPLERGV
jgi:ATP-dependent Clp protease ATP-binding subunit ClpA